MSSGRVLEWIGAYFALGFAISIPYALRKHTEYRLVAIAAVISGIFACVVLIIDKPLAALGAMFFSLGTVQWVGHSRSGLKPLKLLGLSRLLAFWLLTAWILYASFGHLTSEWWDDAALGAFFAMMLLPDVVLIVYGKWLKSQEMRNIQR